MPTLQCYVDDDTLKTLEDASRTMERTVVSLAEAAIAEEACKWKRQRDEANDMMRRAEGRLP